MAEYILIKAFNPGGGTIEVNGSSTTLRYEEGELLNVSASVAPGFTGIDWYVNGVFVSSDEDFSFVMPSQTTYLEGRMSGEYVPVESYGLKYSGSFLQNIGTNARCIGLEIYLDGYEGDPLPLKISNIIYSFGNVGADPLDVVIGSSVDFTIAGVIDQYDEFLTGGNRAWKVVLKDDSVIFWTGFLNPDYLTSKDLGGEQLQTFTAMDGFNSFESIRVDQRIFPDGNDRQLAIAALVGSLNQSFNEFRNLNILCNVHETRMNSLVGLFEQFLTPDNAIYSDGDLAKYTDGSIVENETLYIKDVLIRLLNPFQCRVFLYEDTFWIVRTPDLRAESSQFRIYTPDGNYDEPLVIDNDLEVDCVINRPERTNRRVYTSFTAILKLGVLFDETIGAVYDAKFGDGEWLSIGFINFQLKRWGYVRAQPTGQPDSRPSGPIAGVQYDYEEGDGSCLIWTTTANTGVSDPDISYIFLSTDGTGKSIIVSNEFANKISVEFSFMVRSVAVREPFTNYSDHQVGIMVKIGSYYLTRISDFEFDWDTVENIILFDVENVAVYNEVKIQNLVVPETGIVEVRLYQLICNAGDPNRFALNYDNFKLSIEQNEAMQLAEISSRAVTDEKNTYVHPDYETFIGDSETNMSTSAIRLLDTDNPVSALWTRDGVEEIELLDLICIELANLKGIRNRRILGTLERTKPKPYQSVIYRGSWWMVTYIEWDTFRDSWKVELCELGEIPIIEYTINWELSEFSEDPIFIDANMRIFVNEIETVEQFGTGSGSISVVAGDTIRVQYFYLDLSLGSPTNPNIQLLIDSVIIESQDVIIPGSDTFNYEFEIGANTDILVRSINDV